MGVLPQCTVDHGETEHSHCAIHMIHYDVNRDCICDDEICKATLHFDIGTASNTQRDGKCDTCGIKVYTDFNKDDSFDGSGNNKCDVTGTQIIDANGDGFDDVDGTPIITDMVVNDKYNEGNSTLTYQALYTKTTGAKAIITYNTIIKSVTVKTEDVNFEAFEGYDMTDNDYFMDQKILFDNLTLNSAGFVFDNTVVQCTRSRGILVKTVDATIKNCTFRDHGMTSVLLSVETTWGESTVPQNITVEGCLFDNTGCLTGLEANMTQCPIAIQGLGNLSGSVEVSEDTLPCRDIRIIGNNLSTPITTIASRCLRLRESRSRTTSSPHALMTPRKSTAERYISTAVPISISPAIPTAKSSRVTSPRRSSDITTSDSKVPRSLTQTATDFFPKKRVLSLDFQKIHSRRASARRVFCCCAASFFTLFPKSIDFRFFVCYNKKKDFPLLKYMFFEQMNQTFSQEVFYEGL